MPEVDVQDLEMALEGVLSDYPSDTAAVVRAVMGAAMERLGVRPKSQGIAVPVEMLPTEKEGGTIGGELTYTRIHTKGRTLNPVNQNALLAVQRWNDVTGQDLRSRAHTRLARGRLTEGFTVDELVLVAEWAKRGPRADFFAGENDRHTCYLRPATLWSSSKFEGYLQDANRWRSGQGSSGDNDVVISLEEDEQKMMNMRQRLAGRRLLVVDEPSDSEGEVPIWEE